MDFTDRHVGFRGDAPENVVWSGTSYIESVLPIEQISMKRITGAFVICFFGSFILPFILFWLPKWIAKINPDVQISETAFAVPAFSLITLAILIGFSLGKILKRIIIGKIQKRSDLLFTPDKDCIFVGIEDAFTFDKKKLNADDYGLLKLESGMLLLEMEKFRAQFDISQLRANLFHTAKNLAGVRLTLPDSDRPWSVVLSPQGNCNFITEISVVKRAKHLLEMLVEAGVRSGDESVPAAAAVAAVNLSADETDVDGAVLVAEPVEDIDADIAESRYEQILDAIQKKQQKKGWVKSVGILVISLLIFFQLGFFSWGLETVLLILLVLFVHEMGHFIGMKMFGYKNINMFFIPMLGAAVSGHGHHLAAWKKAFVCLLGPLPGIVISLIIFVMHIISPKDIYLQMGSMFLFINLLNLLPIFPLDGGRFVHEVLFSRNRFLELAVNIITGLVLLALGFATGSWFLRILGFLNLFTVSHKFKLAAKAMQLRKELADGSFGVSEDESQNDDVPEHILKHLITWIHNNIKGTMKPKAIADVALQLWGRIKIHPPKMGATIALLALFFAGYVFSFVSLGALGVSYYKNGNLNEIVEFQKQDGIAGYKEMSKSMGVTNTEIELSDDQQFYHGSQKSYTFDGQVYAQGQWEDGVQVGVWKYFDEEGSLIKEVEYEKGLPMLTKTLQDGKWNQTVWEDMSEQLKVFHRQTAAFQQGPGRFPEYDYSEMTFESEEAKPTEVPVVE